MLLRPVGSPWALIQLERTAHHANIRGFQRGAAHVLFLKKLVAAVFMPLPLAFLFLCIAGLAWWRGWLRTGRLFAVLAVLTVALSSMAPVADMLLSPLERQHPALLDARTQADDVSAIVVLGGGYRAAPGLPVTAQLSGDSQVRLLEGLRLHRQLDHALPLVLSGGSVLGSDAASQGYAEAARALGGFDSSLILLDTPRDTAEEAYAVRERFGAGARVIVVTSASHMPRAVRHFRRAGLEPVPAPTGHLVLDHGPRGPSDWVPTATSLRRTERALYEYMGLLAAGLEH